MSIMSKVSEAAVVWDSGSGYKVRFSVYIRKSGTVGKRNYVGILSTVVCADKVAENAAEEVNGTSCFPPYPDYKSKKFIIAERFY